MRSLSLALGVTDLLSKTSLNTLTGFSYPNKDTCYFIAFVYLPLSIYNIGLKDCRDLLQTITVLVTPWPCSSIITFRIKKKLLLKKQNATAVKITLK